jgi:hypothetical protein
VFDYKKGWPGSVFSGGPKRSIRKALGQVIVYAYFPSSERADKRVIIAGEDLL